YALLFGMAAAAPLAHSETGGHRNNLELRHWHGGWGDGWNGGWGGGGWWPGGWNGGWGGGWNGGWNGGWDGGWHHHHGWW
ncbi:hypothetical protein GGI23_005556, partial [Coemansia sp. RSA 2559]